MKAIFNPNPVRFTSPFLCIVLVSLIWQGISQSVYGQWTKHIIDSSIAYHYMIIGYDIDNDSDMDIFVSEFEANNVLFYENINNLKWTKYIIDGNAGRVTSLDLADFDRDGKMDVLAGCFRADVLAWYRNDGGIPIQWIKDTVTSSMDGPAGRATDINGDSIPDIVAKAYNTGEMIWLENNLPIGWFSHPIGKNMTGSGAWEIVDINDDLKPDVVRSVTEQDKLVLFLNNLPDFTWSEILVDGNLPGTRRPCVADIDNDGDADIVAGAQKGFDNEPDIVWYEGDGSGEVWNRHIITSHLQGARGIDIADFDSNGYLDLVATDPVAHDVLLYLNQDGGKSWIKHTIDDEFTNANMVFTYDIDLDGDFDIIPSRDARGPLIWFENPLGSAYANSLDAYPTLIQPQIDTITVSTELHNPDNHPVHVFAAIQGDQTGFVDTLQLFDDGLHDDVDSSDNVWSNIRLTDDLPEDEFLVDLFTYDSTYGDTLGFVSPARIFTLGPVDLVDHSFVTSIIVNDTTPHSGDLVLVQLRLKNNSTSAIAKNMAVELVSLDTLLSINSPNNHSTFQDIPAGEISTSNSAYWLFISDECPGDTNIAIVANISSHGQVCWQDTFNIHVLMVNVDDVRSLDTRIYPNPTNNLLTIETSQPGQQFIEITSLNGQLLFTDRMEGPTHQIDLSSFQNGIFFITIKSRDYVRTEKIIKQ